jgi:hydrogenase maturation protease
MKRQKLAIIGLGNRLLADEGAGLHAIDMLMQEHERDHSSVAVDFIEAGTPGMNLLHQFDEREKIIFIDAGNCGMDTGQYRRFTPDEAVTLKKQRGYSLHEFDLMGFLEFAQKLGVSKQVEVVIYCIQAAEVVMSESLSPVVHRQLPRLVQDVWTEITRGTGHR